MRKQQFQVEGMIRGPSQEGVTGQEQMPQSKAGLEVEICRGPIREPITE